MPSIVPTGAGQPQNIDVGPNASIARAGWMPDGRLVIQSTRPGEATGVFLLSAAGRDAAPLLPAGLALSGFNVIAPDGSRLVAMDGTRQLLVCTVTAPSCRPLPGTRAGDVMSGWNADGLSVFVYQSQPMEVQVDQIEIASGRRSPWKTVRPINAAVTGVSSLMVAPDGALAYDYNRNRSQLYVIKGLK
jgi:hypothetical protein